MRRDTHWYGCSSSLSLDLYTQATIPHELRVS